MFEWFPNPFLLLLLITQLLLICHASFFLFIYCLLSVYRDVRVWDLDTGRRRHILRGHTSTVRCLKMKDKRTVVTGSRDMSIRVWDIERGVPLHVLLGHQHSVRCIEIHDNIVVSGKVCRQLPPIYLSMTFLLSSRLFRFV